MSIIPSTLYDCWDYVIGLYKGNCTCWDPKVPYHDDYDTSYSGLYLNKIAPLQNLQGLENCENATLWTMMAEARETAVINFVADLNRALSSRYTLKYRPFTGVIGRAWNNKDRAINTTYAGVVLRCNPLKGATMTLTGIETIFSHTGTVDVTVYDNLNTNHGTYTLNTVADTRTTNDITDLELPMYSDYIDNLEYYLTYTVADQPRNNELCCFCGSFKPYYNLKFPYYTKQKKPFYGWANYVMVGGIEVDDVDFMDTDTVPKSKYMNGLILDVTVNCNFTKTYCDESLDFEGDPIAGATAHAILYRSAFLLADAIHMTGEINKHIMIHHEQLIEYQKEWVVKYDEMIKYIAENIDTSQSGCFGCRELNQIHRYGLLS